MSELQNKAADDMLTHEGFPTLYGLRATTAP